MPKRKPATPAKKKVSKPSAPNASETQVTQVDPFIRNEFGVIPPQTGGVPLVFVRATPEDTTQIVSSHDPQTTEQPQQPTQQPPQPTNAEQSKNRGDVANPVAAVDSNSPADSLESIPRARLEGEKRHAYWERMRKAARLAGLPRGQGAGSAYVWATQQAELEFPYVSPVIVEELPDDSDLNPAEPAPSEPVSQITGEETAKAAPVADLGVVGLGEIPETWPELPANAQLQVEIAWVSANRLRVRSGKGVDLARALSPAPSYSALSWLETSILFPSKFADISVKATADQDDEKEFIKREKLAIEEIRSILKEMLAPPAQ